MIRSELRSLSIPSIGEDFLSRCSVVPQFFMLSSREEWCSIFDDRRGVPVRQRRVGGEIDDVDEIHRRDQGALSSTII